MRSAVSISSTFSRVCKVQVCNQCALFLIDCIWALKPQGHVEYVKNNVLNILHAESWSFHLGILSCQITLCTFFVPCPGKLDLGSWSYDVLTKSSLSTFKGL